MKKQKEKQIEKNKIVMLAPIGVMLYGLNKLYLVDDFKFPFGAYCVDVN